MAAFLLLNTANTTLLSAAKNGLFLSVYPGELIPHAVISAALLTALVSTLWDGTTRSPRRAKHAQTSWRPTTCCHSSRR
jgi:hypothetical protein